jgi:hypothetical protein
MMVLPSQMRPSNPRSWLARAYAALYEAKRQCRGRLLQSEGGMGQTVI